jgi:uncharacterized BrkB/YihY/UPF0761 family membrane protein
MNYLIYIIPIIIFVILTFSFYYNIEPKKRNYIKILIPSTIVSILVFLIMKFNTKFESEPMMFGNYFD